MHSFWQSYWISGVFTYTTVSSFRPNNQSKYSVSSYNILSHYGAQGNASPLNLMTHTFHSMTHSIRREITYGHFPLAQLVLTTSLIIVLSLCGFCTPFMHESDLNITSLWLSNLWFLRCKWVNDEKDNEELYSVYYVSNTHHVDGVKLYRGLE